MIKRLNGRYMLAGLMILLMTCSVIAWADDSQYGPIRPGESLWRIFDKVPRQKGIDRFSWMIAVQRLNRHAFSQPCNSNSLKAGVQLDLPSQQQIDTVSPVMASSETHRQAGEWEGYRRRREAIYCSDWFEGLDLAPTSTEPSVSKPQVPEEEAVEPGVEPSAPTAVTPAAPDEAISKEPPAISAPAPKEPLRPVSPDTEIEPPADATLPPTDSEPRAVETADEAREREGVISPQLTAPEKMEASPGEQQGRAMVEPRGLVVTPPWYVTVLEQAWPYLYIAVVLTVFLLGSAIWIVWRGRRSHPLGVSDKELQKAGGYQRRILLSVALVVVVGQGIYAYLNVNSFQQSYLQSVQSQSMRLADYLRQDIEYVLKLGIPLQKLIKIEASLAQILDATPEIEFLEITDLEHRVFYYADHQTMERVTGDSRLSATLEVDESGSGFLALDHDTTNLRLPFTGGKSDTQVGYIQMRISTSLIQSTSREIVWDIVTVILVSLLITFEFLGFFVNHGFSEPLRKLTQRVREAARVGGVISDDKRFTLAGIDRVIANTNRWMGRKWPPGTSPDAVSGPTKQALVESDSIIGRQLERIAGLAAAEDRDSESLSKKAQENLQRIRDRITTLLRFGESDHDRPVRKTVTDESQPLPKADEERIPYHYIRPFVFLFFIAYNLPLSFFPMFVETLYEPLWGLPAEVLIGLPISVFMLFLAMSMLLVGRWLDRFGWYKPLLLGISLFMGGFIMTAYAEGYMELVLYRAISAVGMGIGFMGFQQFVIENTDTRNRNLGFASFLGAFFAGEIVGAVIGGMLADRLGYTNIFLLSSVVSGLAMIGIVLLFRRYGITRRSRVEKEKVTVAQLFGALRDREFLAVVIFQAIPAKIALVGFLMYFVPLYLAHIGTLQSDVARIVMCYALMLVLVGPLISHKLAKPAYRRYYIFVGGLITGSSMALFAFSSEAYIVLLLVAALGIAHSFSLSSQASLIAETRLVGTLGLGAGMGVYRFWERVGNVAGPFIMAGLIASSGYQQAVMMLGIGIILSSLLYITLLFGIPSREEVPTESGVTGESYAKE